MNLRIADILDWLDFKEFKYTFVGDEYCEILGFSSLSRYKKGSITWIKNSDKYEEFMRSKASNSHLTCAIVQSEVDIESGNRIISEDSKEVFFSTLGHFWGSRPTLGVIGEGTVISEDAHVDPTTCIGCNCSIVGEVAIGKNTIVENNVVIQGKVRIGANCIIHSGATIGGDGYGYYFQEESSIGKVEHYGGVEIQDGVEIGCNTCIDRGTIDDTFIGYNVKIDNLVHIAHNAYINAGVCVVAGAIVCGSAILDEGVYIAPGGIVRNQIELCRNSFVGMGAVVTKNVDENMVVMGIPAREVRKTKKGDK